MMARDITIEDVRAYIHAEDDTHAERIEDVLFDGWYEQCVDFEEGVQDYLFASITEPVRARLLDRKVARIKARYMKGHTQTFQTCASYDRSTRTYMRMYTPGPSGKSSDLHIIRDSAPRKMALKRWFVEEMTRRLRKLTVEEMGHLMLTYDAHYRWARDARRNLEDRLAALTNGILLAQGKGVASDDPMRLDMDLAYARALLNLALIPARPSPSPQLEITSHV